MDKISEKFRDLNEEEIEKLAKKSVEWIRETKPSEYIVIKGENFEILLNIDLKENINKILKELDKKIKELSKSLTEEEIERISIEAANEVRV